MQCKSVLEKNLQYYRQDHIKSSTQLENPKRSYRILIKLNFLESSKILDRMLQHLRRETKNLFKKYTSAYLSRLMQREDLRKIVWHPYKIWKRSCGIINEILCNRTRSYSNSKGSQSVLEKILQYYRQEHVKTYRILQYPREPYKIVKDPMGWVWDLRQA